MLKILYKDGTESISDGTVKHYGGSYILKIGNNDNPSFENLKLIHDDVTDESVYWNAFSYGFYEGVGKYKELREKAIRDIMLTKKFNELLKPFECQVGEEVLENSINLLVFYEDEIVNTYNTK